MRRIIAIARKELIHVTRDRRLIGMIVILPLMQLFLYAYALTRTTIPGTSFFRSIAMVPQECAH